MAWKIHICKNTIEKYNAGEYEQVVGGRALHGMEKKITLLTKAFVKNTVGGCWLVGMGWYGGGHGVVAWYGGGHGCGGHGGPNRKDAGRERLGSSTVLTNSIFGFSNIYDS